MRCLYCGKELALLKRLTGGGDFCSDGHKQSYQEEYNRLALSRLLQAQKKGQQATSSPVQTTTRPPHASVAVEEPVPELVTDDQATTVQSTAALDADRDAAAVHDPSPESVRIDTDASISTEPELAELEPVEAAGFLVEALTVAAPSEENPYLESWLELSAGPAMSEWQPQTEGAIFGLSPADLLSLDLRPTASTIDSAALAIESSPQAWPSALPNPSLAVTPTAKKTANRTRFPSSGAVAIEITPNAAALAPDRTFVQPVAFETVVLVDDSLLLELSSTVIDFPPEDSDVVVLVRGRYNGTGLSVRDTNSETTAPGTLSEDNSPRASLEALSRLHQELAEQEAARAELALAESPNEPLEAAAVDVVQAVPVELLTAREILPDENLGPRTVEIVAEEPAPVEETPKPKFTTELFEISIRTFVPSKPAHIGGEPAAHNSAPLLPHMKSLPLRPKVALATGFVPPAAVVPPDNKPVTPAATARSQVAAKPAPSVKPATRFPQPKPPAPVGRTAQPAAPKPVAAKADTPKLGTKPTPAQEQEAATQRAKPVEAKAPAPPAEKASAPKTKEAEKPAVDAAKPSADITKPAAATTKTAADTAKTVVEPTKPAADTTKPTMATTKSVADTPKAAVNSGKAQQERPKSPAEAKPVAPLKPTEPPRPPVEPMKRDNVPNFEIARPPESSWAGSLKLKLGIAIVLLVIACVYFLGWGGKSRQSGRANGASSDGTGPSIIMGEGGWVEGWGGDPSGVHAGRQITIYRPSLKLSDYRLEFQGSIDAKSLGWVFRAADPQDYYAMKLMMVSTGLPPKAALFKYLVANGRQTQVGRVPIDLTVQQDTVFSVRVDVRGPQFTTYIQGQQVDTWTDDQLKIGGAGFLNEREERGKVKSVSIRYLSGGAK